MFRWRRCCWRLAVEGALRTCRPPLRSLRSKPRALWLRRAILRRASNRPAGRDDCVQNEKNYETVVDIKKGGFMRVFLRLAAFVFAVSLAWPVAAQDYPNRPVKFIVPFGAGGPADVYARVLAQHLSEETKQSFVVEDRPGAGSIIGTDAVAKSAPDGYTLLVMSNTHTTNESLLPSKPFQLMRDFVPVATINYSDLLMVVHPSVPAKTVKEFIDLAKTDPGKLNYASSGPGTPYH